MDTFLHAHATHPDWRYALELANAQLRAQRAAHPKGHGPNLGFVYFSDIYAPQAEELLQALRHDWPGLSWVGASGVGISGSGVEYFDEPALVLMLARLPAGSFQVFSGTRPLGLDAHTALVHADPSTPDLAELIAEMSERTAAGYLFGGLASARGQSLQIADGVFRGGLSGVAFTSEVGLISRVTQGCTPVGPVRRVTAANEHLVLELDGKPALDALLADTGVDLSHPTVALPRLRSTLAGVSDAREDTLSRGGQFGENTRVRHLIGLEPGRRGVALAEAVEVGQQIAFCQRDAVAARRDLVRICAEIREEIEAGIEAPAAPPPGGGAELAAASRIAGALYISCAGRGGPHFGAPSAELQIVQHALGDVPLAGFFASGEIGHHHLYGYTGVLTVFTAAQG
ncbi:FIST signal transduction protein [Azohydromonas lata]|uniref:FIST C-terminal domain-containing protein n=1 Tax=Azohydromonas lata TaxID=45677 RepID=A0ABU5IR12_9BURK|nr:FIST N-terminal domain-containing protein [Azohydromonas lata]MDZ5461331.1 FIST C-terminal domain-containing protein [Azohydromonas lata]